MALPCTGRHDRCISYWSERAHRRDDQTRADDNGAWWQGEPLTADRVVSADAPTQVLEGVLSDARGAARGESTPCDVDEVSMACVLVVDDNVELREIYSQALRRFGSFVLVTACDGIDGLTKAKELRPAAVVTDFSMPGMTGGELALKLAGDEQTGRIPVVMISAFADEVPRGERLSCAAFLAKPCEPEELARLVRLAIAATGSAM